MSIYFCHTCRYTFFTTEAPERCPDCGACTICPATPKQVKDYERIRKEIEAEIAEEKQALLNDA